MRDELASLREQGLYKEEAALTTPQSARIGVVDGREVLNLCANNYLGLADSPVLIEAAKKALDEWGFGMASVRFICGTQTLHQRLEAALTQFLHPGADGWDTILYSSCFDANGGLFEVLFSEGDAIISDELNHASIIDGVRLSKAARYRYRNRDMADLEAQLIAAKDARFKIVVTDGVFSMDGYVAPLDEICDLAEKHGALVMVDDSHAVGFVGATGAGTPERFGVQDRVDIVTGTLGKALGGASGGYTCARAEVVEMLRQRSRPYLFSNSLAPSIAAAALATLDLLKESSELRDQLNANTAYFREQMVARGFEIPESDHAIVPVMIGDAVMAAKMADEILARGVYVRAFSYPVVPKGKARIRTQMSAALTREDLDTAIRAFEDARAALD
ncbi:glycine C-acetyltransferase [Tessaracoccus flavus]|uniref:2-amino-3-ketobutyrate coenzyme A ligase n=1 Tax=Tessaracoccus flavus TaxID=1610493 RepID=A0A1Q2CIK7_9ACTN|nr:glycine C-acetyltransferase [Tessaracoccus flavus]AQP45942.1 glycine C-acetyltransferase [Tessaracoccus flavus]